MIKTPLCDLLGVKYPLTQGGMAWVGTAELAGAVSAAGALGIIGTGNASGQWVRDQIRRVRRHTGNPFGVNVMLMSPNAEEVLAIIIEEKVPVVTTGAGSPAQHIDKLKQAGAKVIPVVASVALAKRMERYGADAVIAEGTESGGHVGEMTTMTLVPQVVDAVSIPVIAAGGIGDGRGMAAALALGAVGVQVGTRFICSEECIAHLSVKHRILQASDRSTVVTGESIGHPVRALKNQFTRAFDQMEHLGLPPQEVEAFGTGRMRLGLIEGDVEHGSVMAGQVAGLVSDIKPVKQIIEDMIHESVAVIDGLCRLHVT